MCSTVLRQTRLSGRGASLCCDLLCHLCSHWCADHLFILFTSEESVVTRTLISLHRHVSLSLERSIATVLNTRLHTETGDSAWFGGKRFNKGRRGKQVMMGDQPLGHVTQPSVVLRPLLVSRLYHYHCQLQWSFKIERKMSRNNVFQSTKTAPRKRMRSWIQERKLRF